MTYRRTPVVLQTEEQDCGAACLASVLGSMGCHISLEEAKQACGISRDGASAAAVARADHRRVWDDLGVVLPLPEEMASSSWRSTV